MKDKIIEKRGKKYLGSKYNESIWVYGLILIVMLCIVVSMRMMWIEPMWVESMRTETQEDYYLKIDDAGEDVLGYYVVGDLYQWESLKNGGMHPTGEEGIVVSVSDFVYREIEKGNLISLDEDEDGNYQYAGDIYSSSSVFYSVDDFREYSLGLIVMTGLFFGFVYIIILINRRSSRIIMIDDFNVCYKENRWHGKYIYGRAKLDGSDTYDMIRIDSVWMFLNLEIDSGDSMFKEGGRFYVIRSQVRKIKDINNHIEKLMDVEANQ